MTTYNHMFTIAFTVVCENDGAHVTADELREGLHNRLLNLRGTDEIIEACGLPNDTYIEDDTPTAAEQWSAAELEVLRQNQVPLVLNMIKTPAKAGGLEL